jgi:hypothetical protein
LFCFEIEFSSILAASFEAPPVGWQVRKRQLSGFSFMMEEIKAGWHPKIFSDEAQADRAALPPGSLGLKYGIPMLCVPA